MKRGFGINFSDGMRLITIAISNTGIKISKEYISIESIERILFTNKHPQINGAYVSYKNQTYCVIDYTYFGEKKTITIKPVSNIWSHLKMLCVDKFVDETNGEPTKLSIEFVFGKGFETNKKYKRLFFKIWNISFPFLAIFSLLLEHNLDYGTTVPVISSCVFGVYILVSCVYQLLFKGTQSR